MSTSTIKLSILTIAFVYAIIRYHIFAEVEWTHFPLYVSNKALSFSGVVFLGISLLQSDSSARKEFGLLSMGLIAAHVPISLIILNREYFARFFHEDGKLTLQSELSMLAGVVGVVLMYRLLLDSQNGASSTGKSLRIGLGRTILLLSAAHVGFMGYVTWYPPSEWYGYMPPITLWSFIVAIAFVARKSISSTR